MHWISFYGLTVVQDASYFTTLLTIEYHQCDKPQSKHETTNLIINPLTRTSVSFQKEEKKSKLKRDISTW